MDGTNGSTSYKDFRNINGEDVAGRLRHVIGKRSRLTTVEAVEWIGCVRILEEAFVVSREEADAIAKAVADKRGETK